MRKGFGIYVGWLTLGVWEKHRNRSKSRGSGPECRRWLDVMMGLRGVFFKLLQLTVKSEARSLQRMRMGRSFGKFEEKTVKERAIWWLESWEGEMAWVSWNWHNVTVLWSVNGVQALNFGQTLRVGHESFPEFWAPMMIFAVETGGFQTDGLRSVHRFPLNIRWNVTPSITSH